MGLHQPFPEALETGVAELGPGEGDSCSLFLPLLTGLTATHTKLVWSLCHWHRKVYICGLGTMERSTERSGHSPLSLRKKNAS